ncbi:MAG: SDR family NAD(P)-dependent oxidoreductase [Thermoflexales bacterium]|nr:SDR family NAD(P)-dependent oxidoreductase [Thermoflexales bacterium]
MTDSLRDVPVLVTGAGGFIASHLTERLLAEGARVRAFVRYTARSDIGYLRLATPAVRSKIDFVFGDLRDENAVADAMRDIDVVFHLGALIAIPYSYVHPREVVETNVIGTLNVLMAARQHKTKRVIHTSTSEVYGTALRVPIDEEHPLQGQSPYSASKIGADKLVESFSRSFEVPAVTIRPFNTYGPRQSARAVIPTIISQALTRDEIYLGDLTPTRDFTYVADTADGFVRAALADNVIGETINLGNDREISIGELARLILQLIDRPVELKTDPARLRPSASEVRQLHADNRKAKALLGWSPRTSFESGLLQTIDWIRVHPEYFTPERYTV